MNNLRFIKFDPIIDSFNSISGQNGIYIVVLREGCNLPKTMYQPIFQLYENLRVIYVGQTKDGLYSRIGKKHFNGTGGSSTLRKSIGCLLGFPLIPRSKSNPNDGKTTFEKSDESKLSEWMKRNLIVYYIPMLSNIDEEEAKLICSYSPPLNLKSVPFDENQSFRAELSLLRSKHSR
ncbi:MAG: hypothetical protein IKY82_05170 [Alistipes sp.]|nr:hypothetical protein [Alistipes sp.]